MRAEKELKEWGLKRGLKGLKDRSKVQSAKLWERGIKECNSYILFMFSSSSNDQSLLDDDELVESWQLIIYFLLPHPKSPTCWLLRSTSVSLIMFFSFSLICWISVILLFWFVIPTSLLPEPGTGGPLFGNGGPDGGGDDGNGGNGGGNGKVLPSLATWLAPWWHLLELGSSSDLVEYWLHSFLTILKIS